MQVTDIEEVMRSKEQEVPVLQQAIEQEREPENQEVLSNSGKQIEVSKTEKAGQRTGNQSILVC